jgi:hypothetical protein
MSGFLNDLILKSDEKQKHWILCHELGYETKRGEIIVIPVGTVTDFASIPRLFWTIIGHPAQTYRRAAVLHDYLYQEQFCTRKKADKLFYEAMRQDGVWWHKAQIIHKAVRIGGWAAWRGHARIKK